MIFLLQLPTVWGSLLAILFSVALTATIFITAHLFFSGRRPDKTKTFAVQMALRIGTMHALIVALVFSTLTSELKQLHHLSDVEAISAANIYFSIKNNQAEEAAHLRSRIPLYLKTVIEQDWEEFSTEPHDLPAWKLISEMQAITLNWNTSTHSEVMLKDYVFDNLNIILENLNLTLDILT